MGRTRTGGTMHEVTPEPRKPLSTANRRYWASMVAITVTTFLTAALAGGAVSLLTGAPTGRSSLWAGAVIALVMLAGWSTAARVRDRKKLDLPLWHRLDEEQEATLKQYRQLSRTGRLQDHEDQSQSGVPPNTPPPLRLATQTARFADSGWTTPSSIRKVFLRRPANHVK